MLSRSIKAPQEKEALTITVHSNFRGDDFDETIIYNEK